MKLNISGNEFSLYNNNVLIIEHTQDNPFVYSGNGCEDILMYRGNFKIDDHVISRIPLEAKEIKETDKGCFVNFEDKIKAEFILDGDVVTVKFEKCCEKINRFWFRTSSQKDEKLFGLGEQMSYLNLKGRDFPVFTSEPGVGRDKSTYVTWRSDIDGMAGGDYYHTNYPQPTYVSSNMYFLHLDSTAYSVFNFKNDSFTEIEVWEVPASIRIEAATDYLNMYEKVTALFGRQPQLPEWVYEGMILGLQGGTERMNRLLDRSLNAGIKVSGVWCQDWCGKRVTSFGKRLQWDWVYHNEMYPELPKLIEELHAKGVKYLGYLNPYLVEDGSLYKECYEKGYFATKNDGSDYLVDFGEFYCGVVDLTNPDAYRWFKDEVIIKHTINIGIDGWMADFGEYLPTDDIKLFNGESPLIEHNKWPVRWAQCNYDAVSDTDGWGNLLYFMRAGGTGTQKYCPLLWAGDQSVDMTLHDGLATTIPGALSAGMTGNGFSHSDIGGFTSLYDNVRTKETFLRWAEMAAFTPVMRSHEGNRPDSCFQYYNDNDCMVKLARMVDVFTMISPYTKALGKENAETGHALQRPMFVHYPDDERCYDEQYQYMFGSELLVAPVHKSDCTEWTVYLPDETWIHLFTGKEYTKGEYTVAAPIGCPPVFYKKNSKYAVLFAEVTTKYGL